MKKVILLLTMIALFGACEKESSSSSAVSETNQAVENRASNGKIDVCHYSEEDNSWHTISISPNAWPAHEAHGDVQLVDQDGDGWVAAENECVPGGDCDDNDAGVNPGATEVPYNGKDDDCNPATPDDDLDGDGYVQANDCDDNNAAVNPGATEICDNGIDDDCDGDTDEDDDDCGCSGNLPDVSVDPDGTPGSGDEYTLKLEIIKVGNNSILANWGANAVTGATDQWDGAGNTDKIVAFNGNNYSGHYAAKRCATLAEETGCPWYLPAKQELNTIYQQLGPTEMTEDRYWSSTEFTPEEDPRGYQFYAWRLRSPEGTWFLGFKHDGIAHVVCVLKEED